MQRFYIDLDAMQLIERPGVPVPVEEVVFQRGSGFDLGFQPVRDSVPELLPEGVTIRLMIKQAGKFDGPPVVFTSDFVAPLTADGFYSASPDTNTEPLNELLASPDGNPDNDLPDVELGGTLSWRIGAAPPSKVRRFRVIAENSYDNGNETQHRRPVQI